MLVQMSRYLPFLKNCLLHGKGPVISTQYHLSLRQQFKCGHSVTVKGNCDQVPLSQNAHIFTIFLRSRINNHVRPTSDLLYNTRVATVWS